MEKKVEKGMNTCFLRTCIRRSWDRKETTEYIKVGQGWRRRSMERESKKHTYFTYLKFCFTSSWPVLLSRLEPHPIHLDP